MRFHPDHLAEAPRELLPAKKLYEMIGTEHSLADFDRSLRLYVQSMRPPVVGAFHLTCSDESERECVETFQRGFVRSLLPTLKFSAKSPFRGANLGGRYEWGAVRIAEDHFAMAKGAEDWKLLVVKINAHVGLERLSDGRRFGFIHRYGTDSPLCGALGGLLAGNTLPYANDLRLMFQAEEVDRIGPLLDTKKVSEHVRPFAAALTSARLQARRVMIDIQDTNVDSPTLFIVLPCVTLNQPGHDSEIPVGIYHADRRSGRRHDEYFGLGDRPEKYEIDESSALLSVRDKSLNQPRVARDHRELVMSIWRELRGEEQHDQRVLQAVSEAWDAAPVEQGDGTNGNFKKAALLTALGVMFEFSPIPAALALFGQGFIHIHHANKAHRLARRAAGDHEAREMLEGMRGQVDQMSHEQVEDLTALLATEYGVS
ncbi:MAG: hypothetical protein ACI841_002304 [Planctomycetota bacterium]|jgi:hypothetical protein